MEPGRWERLQRLFHQAQALPEDQRAAFVATACPDDLPLRGELRRLLAAASSDSDTVRAAIGGAAASLIETSAQGRIGRRLGPWRLVAHHADGGMGAVYRAERADGEYQQQVAVKLLNPAYATDDAKARLSAERRILARLEHPHIARLLDGGSTDDGVPYLVMEFVDGEPIDAWCDRHGSSTAQRLRLLAQVCRAVEHAHRNLVVHRDLKPSNILVDGQGQPRLLDFGIAKLLDDSPGVTRTGERVLTPSHASPEQITGGPVTTATDVYALGVLIYDLLAGKPPYGGGDTPAATLARQIVETQPPRPSTAVTGGSSRRLAAARERGERLTAERLARELAGDLDNIALMALRKEPERRYTSAAALAEDIDRCLAHLPVRARPDTLGYRSSKFLRRHRVAVPVTAVALVMALGGAAAFTWQLADERDRALAAEASARSAAAFTASVLENTSAARDAAREVSVQTVLERATARVGSELSDEPEVATRMRLAIATAFHSWGAYDEALQALQPALDEARARGPAGERDLAEVLTLLGTVTHDLGQMQTSLDWTRQAEAVWRRVGNAAEQASALSDLALALNGLRLRTEAEPVFRDALAKMREAHPGDHDDIAWLLNNLAWGLHAMGRLDEAQPLYEEAVAMQRRMGTALVDRSQTQNNLAGLYYDRGEMDRAEQLWREVLAQFESVYGAGGHAAVARGQNLLAVVAIDRGQFDAALQLTGQALATNVRLLGENHRWTATTLQSHGVALLRAGQLDEAERHLLQAQAIRRDLLPPAHAGHVGSFLGLARLGLARNTAAGAAQAERALREALAIIDALPSPDRVPLDAVELTLARALALQGQRAEAGRLATGVVARMQAQKAASHWRRRAAEAVVGLPPFVAVATPQAVALAQQTRGALGEQLGPQAPVVQDIEAGLRAAGAAID